MNDLIRELVEANGPSGFEDPVRELIRTEIESAADELTVDTLGNLIALKRGNGSGRRVMVAAHMDEIGVMVTHITKEGFLRFVNIGGVYPRTLWGSRVVFANGVAGVVYSDRITERDKVQPLEKHFIDVGASGPDDCPVKVGDAANFVRPFLSQGKRVTGKSMDDRIGCAVGIESLKRLDESPNDVYFVFSVQEEVGTRGAIVAANRLEPEIGIAIDVTRTGDLPEGFAMEMRLGKGPGIKIKDGGMIAHTGLVKAMRQRADENGIPYQLEVLEGGSTDARSIQITHGGSAAGCISIPCRYVHTQSETVDLDDVENAVKLLVAILSEPIEL